jgi:hypothetical protein
LWYFPKKKSKFIRLRIEKFIQITDYQIFIRNRMNPLFPKVRPLLPAFFSTLLLQAAFGQDSTWNRVLITPDVAATIPGQTATIDTTKLNSRDWSEQLIIYRRHPQRTGETDKSPDFPIFTSKGP